MTDDSRVFSCTAVRRDKFTLSLLDGGSRPLRFMWEDPESKDVFLSRESCERLVGQLRSYIDHRCLLPLESQNPTSNAKETAKALLAAIGLEVDLDEIRVIQEAKED